MPEKPTLENFNVLFGLPGARAGGRRPVVSLASGESVVGVHFTVEGDWSAPDGGTWELGLRVSDETGAVVPVSDLHDWYAHYSVPIDFDQTPRFHDQTVFLVAVSKTGTLTFERLLEDDVLASSKVSLEVKQEA
jgi:hypothetical protein